jgi:hypothetical protein
MKPLLGFLWVLVVAGGGSLYWWFMYGPCGNAEGPDTLLAHDAVRFGLLPMYLALSWLLLVLCTPLATIGFLLRESRKLSWLFFCLSWLILFPVGCGIAVLSFEVAQTMSGTVLSVGFSPPIFAAAVALFSVTAWVTYHYFTKKSS